MPLHDITRQDIIVVITVDSRDAICGGILLCDLLHALQATVKLQALALRNAASLQALQTPD